MALKEIKPVYVSALIILFIFYSNLFKIPEKNQYKSLIQKEKVLNIKGQIISSPCKTSSGKYYSANFKVVSTASEQFTSSANGIIKILIPSSLVEAYFPGKLYSISKDKGAFLYEAGGNYDFNGNFTENYFIVESCSSCKFCNNLYGKIDFFRSKCRLIFKRMMYGWNKAGGLFLALLSGSKEYTDEKISENFRNAGLSHILALSGMHLSIFSAISVFIGRKLKNKLLTYILRTITITIFVWFAGFSPSLLRAFICNILLILSALINVENTNMVFILCTSFLFQVSFSTGDVKNTGFILSYGALFGILCFSKIIKIILNKILPQALSTSFSASISAQTITMPITLKIFGFFAPIGIIATTVVSPLISVFIYSGIFLFIITLIFPQLLTFSALIMNFMYNIIEILVNIFSKFPQWRIN